MRSFKLGLGLAAALTCGVAMTASASAASFLSSAKENLLSQNVATQVFTTEAGTLECTKAPVTAGASSGTETSEQEVTIAYESCIAFGLVSATITPVEYAFAADGEVAILKQVRMVAPSCEVTVPAQAVGTVDFVTKGNNILLEPLVSGILYTSAGSLCAKTGTFTNGTYKGHTEVMIPTGKLSFMAEGGEEAAPILSITPVESNEKNQKCPNENADKEAEFLILHEWCEYKVKNENKKNEAAFLQGFEMSAFAKDCEIKIGVYCTGFKNAAMGNQCTVEPVKMRLAAGGSCFVALEYKNQLMAGLTSGTKFRVKATSARGDTGYTPAVSQIVR